MFAAKTKDRWRTEIHVCECFVMAQRMVDKKIVDDV